eukprot:3022140-Prymnesium_polylepis.1
MHEHVFDRTCKWREYLANSSRVPVCHGGAAPGKTARTVWTVLKVGTPNPDRESPPPESPPPDDHPAPVRGLTALWHLPHPGPATSSSKRSAGRRRAGVGGPQLLRWGGVEDGSPLREG